MSILFSTKVEIRLTELKFTLVSAENVFQSCFAGAHTLDFKISVIFINEVHQ